MYDESTLENSNPENKIDIILSTGEHLIFKPNKSFTWEDYETYEDLGAGMKGEINTESKKMEVDLSSSARSTRSQKIFLIKFYWDAYNVNFAKLQVSEIVELLKPIKDLGFLTALAEALRV